MLSVPANSVNCGLKRGNAIVHRHTDNRPSLPFKVSYTLLSNRRRDALLESINQLTILLQQLEGPSTIVSPQASVNYNKTPLFTSRNDNNTDLSMVRELEDLVMCMEQMKVSSNEEKMSFYSLNNENCLTFQRELDELLKTVRSEMRVSSESSSITPIGLNENCFACGKSFVGDFLSAMGKFWHQEHFKCHACFEILCTQNFYEQGDEAFCESCHQSLFSLKCAYCGQAILDKCLTAMGQTWHPEHFFCTSCQCFFDENVGFHERNSKPYCADCFYTHFGLKCSRCKKAIISQYVSALNAYWHHHCFVCQECHQPFISGSFYEVDGIPYCEPHYHAKRDSLCHACKQPITDLCVNAMGRKYHPQHFLCSFCGCELNKGTFKENNEQPYCQDCSIKLFS